MTACENQLRTFPAKLCNALLKIFLHAGSLSYFIDGHNAYPDAVRFIHTVIIVIGIQDTRPLQRLHCVGGSLFLIVQTMIVCHTDCFHTACRQDIDVFRVTGNAVRLTFAKVLRTGQRPFQIYQCQSILRKNIGHIFKKITVAGSLVVSLAEGYLIALTDIITQGHIPGSGNRNLNFFRLLTRQCSVACKVRICF